MVVFSLSFVSFGGCNLSGFTVDGNIALKKGLQFPRQWDV